ncbi:Gag-pol polyprotein [Nosema granulosis]|uniref:Gag-pol polyprotein n=1 Tax=Nosema granulosis TaxID=83296 RepID=A0A9P6GWD6_9MICR|nr:Gag-pol polyprotein [Nosema granulosis]
MERLMIDLIDMKRYKEENVGFSVILTIIDVYSKFSWAFPLKTKTGKEVAETLESFFYRFTGPPTILQSDNGKEFIKSEKTALHEKFFFVFKHSRPRHRQAQGQVERFNQTLSRYLQKHIFEEGFGYDVDIKHWLKHLNVVMYNYNSARHSATGKTPFRLFMGIPGFNTIINPLSEEDFVIEMNDIVADIGENTSNKNKEVSKESFPSFLESSSDEVWEPSVSSTYLNRMDRHSLLHLSKYDIEVGDTVMISIDFDSNTNTKKLKLSSFFF